MKKNKKSGNQKVSSKQAHSKTADKRATNVKLVGALIAISVISALCYLPVFTNDLVNWDDSSYVTNNTISQSFNLKLIFSEKWMGNYHPLTMLVYAIEYKLWGLYTPGYHIANLLLHLVNTLLVFSFIRILSKRDEIALMSALIFGIHPIHVESVAWASELKDLLYTLFFVLTLIQYMRFRETGQWSRYVLAMFFFLLSLLGKGMAASLPVVLIIIDYYQQRRIDVKSLLEKVPFFAIALALGIVAVVAQKTSNAIQEISSFSYPERIVFAAYSLVQYILKLIIPLNLSAYYPYPLQNSAGIPLEYYAYALIFPPLVVAIVYSMKSTRKIAFAFAFLFATVFLVLQLLPVGGAIMADRYAYVPSIGFCYIAAELLWYLWQRNQRVIVFILLGFASLGYGVKTYAQSKVWNNGMNLWNNVIEQSQIVSFAYNNRGILLADAGKHQEALKDYNRSIELRPDYAEAYIDRALLMVVLKRYDDALKDYNTGIQLKPDFPNGFYNRGLLYFSMKNYDAAVDDYTRAIANSPGMADAYYNRSMANVRRGRWEDVISDCSKTLELKGDYAFAYYNRAVAYFNTGRQADCCRDLEKSARMGYDLARDMQAKFCK